MKSSRSFIVRARLPEALAPLHDLAMNLWWSWDDRCQDLFKRVDPATWERIGHNPVGLLYSVGRERLDELASDQDFLGHMNWLTEQFGRYLQEPRWLQERDSTLRSVAYFSPEFGISEAVPQYSGGLGVLAGDHLKAAGDAGLPLDAVGLLYRHGYFQQALDVAGWQREHYPTLDPDAMALTPVDGVDVIVDLAGTELNARVFRADVGRIRLYLLDANVAANDEDGRGVTDRLYGGGQEHRIRQEILLGIGGVRALTALGVAPQVFHTNEGHAGFLTFELIRRRIVEDGLTFVEAVEATRAQTAFTTHTPVPAGIDRFPRELMERYFSRWAKECDIDFEQLMKLGWESDDDSEAPFNMALMSLRMSGFANGVSELHGEVSRKMFSVLWPDVPTDEVPIGSITNGVHARTWTGREMADLLSRHIGDHWAQAEPSDWERIEACPPAELWGVKRAGCAQLTNFVRKRLRDAGTARGASQAELHWCDEALDPDLLTIGFARRFAGYKRATLLLSQPERLRKLLLSPHRGVQLVFAGKAHPADDWGKKMIQEIVQFSSDSELRTRMAFIENYDMAVAREMFRGVDVWLNTPRRPQEASGTSGMKAALNGALNCSILDGWWDEMYNPSVGWAIPSAEAYGDDPRRDELEASALFDLLERRIVPLFYERDPGSIPYRWVERMKASLMQLGPRVGASRMIHDYAQNIYIPAARYSDEMTADGFARAKSLADWKVRVRDAWPKVRAWYVEADQAQSNLGSERDIAVDIDLGGLNPNEVHVQVLHGPLGTGEDFESREITVMQSSSRRRDETRYRGTFACDLPGRYGYSVRIVPTHPDLVARMDLGLVAWAADPE